MLAVAETHTNVDSHDVAKDGSGVTVTYQIVSIDLSTGRVTPLASGADFYAAPRVSPAPAWAPEAGRQVAWIQWPFTIAGCVQRGSL